mmetsp:Transcript_25202/g.40450  ORF Transcript_25202/g.40450 Transcript_25202/m.40450 type:complete len:123 (+) Transcript_25202:87-455(+)
MMISYGDKRLIILYVCVLRVCACVCGYVTCKFEWGEDEFLAIIGISTMLVLYSRGNNCCRGASRVMTSPSPILVVSTAHVVSAIGRPVVHQNPGCGRLLHVHLMVEASSSVIRHHAGFHEVL